MGVSTIKVVLLTIFLILGMVMAGIFTQPKASFDVWSIKEGDFPASGKEEDRLMFLLNYVVLAPSSYNTQPWRFNVSGDKIGLYADATRWLTVADADKRELNIGLGCALENLVIAAEHFGYIYNISYLPGDGSLAAVIELHPGNTTPKDTMLFNAILARSASSDPYEDRIIPDGDLQKLRSISADEGIGIYMTSNAEAKNKISDLAALADRLEYSSTDYKSELGYWLGQGMMGPTGAEARVAQIKVLFLDSGEDQVDRDGRLVASAPVLGFICSARNDRISQIKAGQTFEQLRLSAAATGMGVYPMNQVLAQPQTKAEVAGLLPPGSGYPQQAFLLGYSENMDEHMPRIPVNELMVQDNKPT